MKYALLALIFAGLGLSAQAQSVWYNLQPNDTVYGVAPFDNLTIFDIYQFNNQPNNIVLKWQKVSEVLPAGWDFSMCDYATCYPGLPQSGTMAAVAPGDSGFLGWNVMPNQVEGLGILRYYVYDENHPTEGDTLTWIVTTPDFNGVSDVAQARTVVYPVPASNAVTVLTDKTMNQVELVSIAGQVLYRWEVGSTSRTLELSSFANGAYLLRVKTTTGALVTKRLLIAK